MIDKAANTGAEQKIIFHIDVNSAFLSWSAVKKLQEEPGSVDLRTIPSVVGGDPKSRHGIVTAKSVPAKKYGIHTADTIASALQKCPNLVIVPSDFQTYRAFSHAFLDILRSYTPLVEQASIDEAYMDATDLCRKKEMHIPQAGREPEAGTESAHARQAALALAAQNRGQEPEAGTESAHVRQAALALAAGIRLRIREELGFTVNVGISTNRLLAKMASDFEKPDRTHTLFPEEVEKKMWPLPIGDLYGCGGRTSTRLRTLGIQTIGDAAKTPVEILIDNLGEKSGKYIHRAANGLGRAGITPVREDAKSYSNEYTTSSDITRETYEAEYLPLLHHLCDKVAGRLQRDGVYGKTVVVTVKTDDFRRRSAQRRLRDASNRGQILYETAVTLSDKLLLGERGLFAEGAGIRLVGAGVTDLDDGSYRQMSLLDWEPEEESGFGDVIAGKDPAFEERASEKKAPAFGDREFGKEPAFEERASGKKDVPGDRTFERKKPALGDRAAGGVGNAPEQDSASTDRAARLQEMEAKINGKYGKGTVSRGMT